MTIFSKFTGSLPRHRSTRMAIIVLLVAALCSLALADGRIFRVARISLIEGEVSYQRANDSKTDWFDATLNLPLDEIEAALPGRVKDKNQVLLLHCASGMRRTRRR